MIASRRDYPGDANLPSTTQLAFAHNERALSPSLRMADTLRDGIRDLASAQAGWINALVSMVTPQVALDLQGGGVRHRRGWRIPAYSATVARMRPRTGPGARGRSVRVPR